jgi:DNA modification methylase
MNIIVNKMTTGVACLRTMRNFIGIEKEEKYFNIATERIRKEQDDIEQSLYYRACDLQE